MSDYNKKDFYLSFKKIGIKKNDSLFITSSIGALGIPNTKKKILLTASKWIFENLTKILGKKGNIFVPTYSYTFSKQDQTFDPKKTKSKIGFFPNFFIKQKNVFRSHDPMMSISGLGPKVKKILKNIPNNSFGNDCVYERLINIKNLKICNIGLGYNWIPFLHYLDWKNKVKFRFNKKLFGYIKGYSKKKINWIYFARILRKETQSNGHKIGYIAFKKKLYKRINIGKSHIYIANYKKLFNFSKKITKKNNWLTVDGPKFKI